MTWLIYCHILLQYVIRAPKTGIIETVFYKSGDSVKKGVALVHFKEGAKDKIEQNQSDLD